MIRAVVFDFAGVLTSSPFDGVLAYEAELGYPPGSLVHLTIGDYGEIHGDHPWHRLERGEIEASAFWLDLKERAAAAGLPISLRQFVSRFAGSFAVRESYVDVARRLRPAYRTAVLTNNVREFAGVWRDMIGVDDLFDAVVDSSDVGIRKPHPDVYLHTCRALGVAPGEAVFLDDSRSNVDGALAVGMAAIWVDDAERSLGELGDLLGKEGVAGWPPGT